MGLDWNPIGKPKPGHEDEFERLFRLIADTPREDPALEAMQHRWFEIQVLPYETLRAPRVGTDAVADAWARERFKEIEAPTQSEEEFLRELDGYYVLSLAPPCDGLPRYSHWPLGYVEAFSFRGEFLRDCADILGDELLERCHVSGLAPHAAAIGAELRAAADAFASTRGLAHVEFSEDSFEPDTPESQVHILYAAARWCEYWSSRGHGLEADW